MADDNRDGVIVAAENVQRLFVQYTQGYNLLKELTDKVAQDEMLLEDKEVSDAINKLVGDLGTLRELMVKHMKKGAENDG